jgi:uncharacterized membrane protein
VPSGTAFAISLIGPRCGLFPFRYELVGSVQAPSAHPSSPWLGAAVGGTLILYGSRRRGALGTLAGLAGAGIAAQALAPAVAGLLRHAGLARQTVDVHTTLIVDRPIREMFALCSNFENFPRVVAALRDVTDFDDGRSRWAIAKASGELLEWDVIVTKYVPSQVIAWESVPAAPVESAGVVRFAPEGPDRTRLDLTVRYRPRFTSLGDALRALVGPPRGRAVRAAMADATDQLSHLAPPPSLAADAPPPPPA